MVRSLTDLPPFLALPLSSSRSSGPTLCTRGQRHPVPSVIRPLRPDVHRNGYRSYPSLGRCRGSDDVVDYGRDVPGVIGRSSAGKSLGRSGAPAASSRRPASTMSAPASTFVAAETPPTGRYNVVDVTPAVLKLWARVVQRFAARYDSSAENVGEDKGAGLFEEQEESSLASANQERSNHEAWKTVWRESDATARASQWPGLVVHYLQTQSPSILTMLIVTLIDPLPSPRMVADTLELIALHNAHENDSLKQREHMRKLCQMVHFVLRRYETGFPLSERTINLILPHLTTKRKILFLAKLQRCKVEVDPSLLESRPILRVAFALASRPKNAERALDMLKLVERADDADDHQAAQISRIFARLLHTAQLGSIPEMQTLSSKIMAIGAAFGTPYFNALLHTASENDRYTMARQILEQMRQAGVQPDSATYAIVFKCSRRASNFHLFRELYGKLRMQLNDDPLFRPAYQCIAEVAYASHAFTGHLRKGSMDAPLRVYLQHAEIQPLLDLGIIDSNNSDQLPLLEYQDMIQRRDPRPCGPPNPPHPELLALIMMIWIRSQKKWRPIAELYRRFRNLYQANDRFVSCLVDNPTVWHAFLDAFGRYRQTGTFWAIVLGDMLDPRREFSRLSVLPRQLRPFAQFESACRLGLVDEFRIRRQPYQPTHWIRPAAITTTSTLTWNIVMAGFARTKQLAAAQAVLDLMLTQRQQRRRPDQVSWNTLIRAYMTAGEQDKAKEIIDQAQGAGWERDEFTEYAMHKVKMVARPGLGSRVRGGGITTILKRRPNGTFKTAPERLHL